MRAGVGRPQLSCFGGAGSGGGHPRPPPPEGIIKAGVGRPQLNNLECRSHASAAQVQTAPGGLKPAIGLRSRRWTPSPRLQGRDLSPLVQVYQKDIKAWWPLGFSDKLTFQSLWWVVIDTFGLGQRFSDLLDFGERSIFTGNYADRYGH